MAGARGIAAALAALLVVAGGASAAVRPSLRVVADAPITVAGAGFRPHESVRVTIVMGSRRLGAAATASALGRFVVRVSGTRLDRCATPLVLIGRGTTTPPVTLALRAPECAAP